MVTTISALAFFAVWLNWGQLTYGALPTGSELGVLKKEYQGHQGNLYQLRNGLGQLESDLGKKSASYLEALRKQQDLVTLLNRAESNVRSSEERLKQNYGQLKRSLRQALLGQLTEEDSGPEIVANRYVLSSLKKLVQEFDQEINLNQNLQLELKTLRTRLTEYQTVEEEIQGLIREMEMKKKNLADDYWKEISMVDNLKKQIEKLRPTEIQSPAAPSSVISLSSPAQDCGELVFKEKSVELNCPKNVLLRAPAAGKVAFSGELSTFGRVILIDHGNDFKTVLLGELMESVQKGQKVEKGAIIGTTKGNGSAPLVFELRKKNIALQSKHWAKSIVL